MSDVHQKATEGYSKEAASYARGRPEYPDAMLEWLGHIIKPEQHVVDLGAGTGKFTRLLLKTGAQVTAVEPVDAMREQLSRDLPSVTALAGTAERIPLPDGSAVAVVCAQSFHWFATKAALAEIHRVLKPGGTLLLVWNVRDESVDWVAALTTIMMPHEGDAPRFYKGDWRKVFPAEGFGELIETKYRHQHVGPAEQVVVDRVRSVSFIAALPDAQREQVIGEVRRLLTSHPALAGRAEICFPYTTLVCCCHKLA
jgi:ubiquinone/menaquinone biosynthesis C-methylase UbiE